MLSLKVILSTICVLAAACFHLEAKQASQVLKFVEDNYGKALSEYHAINKKVLHVRATGGKGKIQYSINETGSPFEIDAKGHIWLRKTLNSDNNKICELTVIAQDEDHNSVSAKVRFDIMNMNKHKPKFQNKTYQCFVTENTRLVTILPAIRVTDQDHGDAGKIHRIVVLESGIPFKFNIKQNGDVEAVATKDLDAEKESGFSFDIKAWDSGDPPKASDFASMDCFVVDANEFAPEFEKHSYVEEIALGQKYSNILQITAKDKDIGKDYGKVCKYIIKTADVPFSINNDGVLSLTKGLGPEAPKYCAFEVAAIDCGGKMSVKNVNVRINICKPDYVNSESMFGKVYIPQCVGAAILAPEMKLNKCSVNTSGISMFEAKIKLASLTGKTCDRPKYRASDMYEICGADKVKDLLPMYGPGREWTKQLTMAKTDSIDDPTFLFGGDDHVDIPSKVFPQRLGDKFTVSFWMATKNKKSKPSYPQVILSSVDAADHNRIHFAVIMKRHNEIEVIHRLEDWQAGRNQFNNSAYHYIPSINIADDKFHHVTITVNRADVKLYIDGQRFAADTVDSDFPLHKSHNGNRVVVGARWKAKSNKYVQHFRGYLSGMTVRPFKKTLEQTIRCLLGCHEHINIDTSLPKGFTSTMPSFNVMKIEGQGHPADFEKILKNIQYQNDLFAPTVGIRKVQISVIQNGNKLPTQHFDVEMEENTKPVIKLSGCEEIKADMDRISGIGIPVCRSLLVHYEGCDSDGPNGPVNKVKFLDQAVVTAKPAFTDSESFEFPKGKRENSMLDDLDLDVSRSKDGIVIRGVASYHAYERVLREMTYVNRNPGNKLSRTFTISVSDQNGRFVSTQAELPLTAPRKQKAFQHVQNRPFQLQAVGDMQREELPGAAKIVGEPVVRQSKMSKGIMALIIIASACVFVVLVALGAYRLKKSALKLEVPATASEKEEMYWDDTGLSGVRITVNPLQKFQELDLNEDDGAASEHGNSDDEDNQKAKGNLEWDESAM